MWPGGDSSSSDEHLDDDVRPIEAVSKQVSDTIDPQIMALASDDDSRNINVRSGRWHAWSTLYEM